MSLSSLQLDAFTQVAKTLHFSAAAKALGLTQSALSQRILNLEDELGTALFLREPSGVRLTELGEELLRYSRAKNELEGDFLKRVLSRDQKGLAGYLRIGGFSTVVRSVILPSIKELLLKNPELQIELTTREMRDLPGLLRTGGVDYLLLDHPIERAGVISQLIGYEEIVLIEAKNRKCRDVYLDHDSEDTMTLQFFRHQGKAPKTFKRSFLDEIYGLIDGVEMGLGRAVVSKHLIEDHPKIRVVNQYKPLRVPVYLHFYEQPFYSRTHKALIECFGTSVAGLTQKFS